MILTIKTDNPDAEIGIFDTTGKQLAYHKWHADRQLAKTLLSAINDLLKKQNASWQSLTGVAVFEGPGSFTGLRIGITVANTLAYGLGIPIVAAKGNDWLQQGLNNLQSGKNDRLALPHYGSDAHITTPKK